ncbi:MULTISPECIES: ABC transporter permease [Stenotrophomonas]|uniref:ABC transporter permease n=1 Tax=Stenotrophomonas TaxID=40323 RepID=UPI001F31D791|nr:ABC transporter permease [Stenotrophomonas sp. PA-6-5C]MCF5091337.1 FtsX-like permease family protein [Stenotrophomonas sp. PA-6-5C]
MAELLLILENALKSIRAHALRSLLTVLGIIIGVGSVIAVVSIFQGMAASITEQFAGLGANSLSVRAETSFEDQLQGRRSRISLLDFQQLQDSVQYLAEISPTLDVMGDYGGTVSAGRVEAFTRVIASSPSYQHSRQVYPRLGRFITEADNDSRRRVCVIGEALRKNLNLRENPLGDYIRIDSEWCKVVGVMEERGEVFGFSQDDFVLVPFSTGLALVRDVAQIDLRIDLHVRDRTNIELVKQRSEQALRRSRRLSNDVADDFRVETPDQLGDSLKTIINLVSTVFAGVVGISLLVGGIGIMNIMLVSVTERTREIGICKALGATSRSILLQFLGEAMVLSAIGGLIGVVIGYAGGALASALIPGLPAAVVPWWAVILSVAFSGLVGVIFGIIPAAKAARLDPIEALRYE